MKDAAAAFVTQIRASRATYTTGGPITAAMGRMPSTAGARTFAAATSVPPTSRVVMDRRAAATSTRLAIQACTRGSADFFRTCAPVFRPRAPPGPAVWEWWTAQRSAPTASATRRVAAASCASRKPIFAARGAPAAAASTKSAARRPGRAPHYHQAETRRGADLPPQSVRRREVRLRRPPTDCRNPVTETGDAGSRHADRHRDGGSSANGNARAHADAGADRISVPDRNPGPNGRTDGDAGAHPDAGANGDPYPGVLAIGHRNRTATGR
jgi:hypothetical protein